MQIFGTHDDNTRAQLAQFVQLLLRGERNRNEIFPRARAEADALIGLLDQAPQSVQPKAWYSPRCTGVSSSWLARGMS